MSMSIDRKQLYLSKPYSIGARTPSSAASRPFTFVRTKRLSNSYIQAASNRHHTQRSMIEDDSYLPNLEEIRKLKHQLMKLNERKRVLQNPEYAVSVSQDISAWENTINILKDELQSLRKQSSLRIKRVFSTEKKEKQLRTQLQEQIKNRNNLSQTLSKCQQQVSYTSGKLQEQDLTVQMLENQEINTMYLNKLKHIDVLQQQIVNNNKHLSKKYQSSKKKIDQVNESIFEHQTSSIRCEQSILDQTNELDALLLLYYGDEYQSEQQEI